MCHHWTYVYADEREAEPADDEEEVVEVDPDEPEEEPAGGPTVPTADD